MKIRLLFIFFIAICSISRGQVISDKLELGPVLKEDNSFPAYPRRFLKPLKDKFISYYYNYLYGADLLTSTLKPRTLTFRSYDHSMKHISQNNFPLKHKGHKLHLLKVVVMGEHLYIFSTYWDKKQKSLMLVRQELDTDDFTLKGSGEELLILPAINELNARIFLAVSPEHSKIAMYGIHTIEEEGINSTIMVMDENTDILWENKKKPKAGYACPVHLSLTENGTLLLGILKCPDSGFWKEIDAPDTMNAYVFTNQGQQENQFQLEVQGKISSFQLAYSAKENEVIITGIHAGEKNDPSGFFFQNYDLNTGKFTIRKHFPFENYNPDDAWTYQGSWNLFPVVRKMILRSDGGALFIAQFWQRKYHYLENEPSPWRYYYSDLVLGSIDGAGNVDWIKRIPMEGFTFTNYPVQEPFSLVMAKSKLNFIVRRRKPDPKNKKIEFAKRARKRDYVVLISVEINGEIKEEVLLEHKYGARLHLTMGVEQSGPDSAYFFVSQSTYSYMAKLNF